MAKGSSEFEATTTVRARMQQVESFDNELNNAINIDAWN